MKLLIRANGCCPPVLSLKNRHFKIKLIQFNISLSVRIAATVVFIIKIAAPLKLFLGCWVGFEHAVVVLNSLELAVLLIELLIVLVLRWDLVVGSNFAKEVFCPLRLVGDAFLGWCSFNSLSELLTSVFHRKVVMARTLGDLESRLFRFFLLCARTVRTIVTDTELRIKSYFNLRRRYIESIFNNL